MKLHVSLSVEGALKNWKKSEWQALAKSNGCTADEMKEGFWALLREGKQVIPLGPECEGFSYTTGCPGHKQEDEA